MKKQSTETQIHLPILASASEHALKKNNNKIKRAKHLRNKKILLPLIPLRKMTLWGIGNHTNRTWSFFYENYADKRRDRSLCSGKHLEPSREATGSNDQAKSAWVEEKEEFGSNKVCIHLPTLPGTKQLWPNHTGEGLSIHSPAWKVMRAAGAFSSWHGWAFRVSVAHTYRVDRGEKPQLFLRWCL